MKKCNVFTNRRFCNNRIFYDSLMREVVCELYSDTELSGDMLLPIFKQHAGNYPFMRIRDVLSEKDIRSLKSTVEEIKENEVLPDSIPALKKILLKYFSGISDCHLDGINYMQWTVSRKKNS